MSNSTLIVSYCKDTIKVGNSLLIKSNCETYCLSLENIVGKTSKIYVDKGIWKSSNMNLPKDKWVEFKITDDYVEFYETDPPVKKQEDNAE
tara:strand:+ start:1830 stop:2102 length:273 start_codon:yes stop_codon:yes gene_type:complete